MTESIELSCPLPFSRYERVVLAHGGGGRVMQQLIRGLFVEAFDSPELRKGHDGAVLDLAGPIAMTTDAFVVHPLFFPGGDIGSLSVHGTVNDLAMCGARAQYLSASFVLEEGLPMNTLERIVRSMAKAARAAGVEVVTGDTKVVERGKGDGVFITTTGVGQVLASSTIGPAAIRPGDAIVVNGPIGDHGMAVMAEREHIDTDGLLESDSASVAPQVMALLDAGIDVHCMRDLTRGGLASCLNEIADESGLGVRVEDEAIPVRETVADVCELLGLDPTYVACEGRFIAIVPASQVGHALEILGDAGDGGGEVAPARIGEVTSENPGSVIRHTALGGEHLLDLLSGEQLPRIC